MGRIERLRAAALKAGLDALLITPGPALRYLTRYNALPLERLTCLIVSTQSDPVLLVPELEEPAAHASEAGKQGIEISPWAETVDPIALVADILSDAHTVGLDDHMPAEKVLRLQDALPNVTWRLAGPALSTLRMIKSQQEIDALREAAKAIDRVHASMAEWLRPGRTEEAVAADIERAIRDSGHAQVDFVIVASGPNGGSPHHEPSDRMIEPGDPVVVDIGGTTQAGYCSDETRTYVVGQPPSDFMDHYEALVQAHEAAVAQVKPGVTADSVDAAARTELTNSGLGEYFIHRTGHGIGVETHEEPYIVAGNALQLAPGMVFSIEPGFYIPHTYGARIEDIVAVTDNGAEVLNQRPRALASLEG